MSYGNRIERMMHKKKPNITVELLSGRQDSNLRPHDPQPCTLPGCATSRTLYEFIKTGDANIRIIFCCQ